MFDLDGKDLFVDNQGQVWLFYNISTGEGKPKVI